MGRLLEGRDGRAAPPSGEVSSAIDAAVELGEVGDDREAEARPGRRFVGAHAAPQHRRSRSAARHAGAIVVDDDRGHDAVAALRRDAAPWSAPHLQALSSRLPSISSRSSRCTRTTCAVGHIGARSSSPRSAWSWSSVRTSAAADAATLRTRRRAWRPRRRRARAPGDSRSAAACARPAAAARPRRRRGRAGAALGFVRDDRQRRLQAVREVAGPRERPAHRLGRGGRAARSGRRRAAALRRETRPPTRPSSPACTRDSRARSRASAARPAAPETPPARHTHRHRAGDRHVDEQAMEDAAETPGSGTARRWRRCRRRRTGRRPQQRRRDQQRARSERGALMRRSRRGSRARAPSRSWRRRACAAAAR